MTMPTLPVPQCKICSLGVAQLSPERTQTEWSEYFNVARSSVQRHIDHVRKAIDAGYISDEFVGDSQPVESYENADEHDKEHSSIASRLGIPEHLITTRTVSEWGNGKSEKITYKPNAVTVQDALKTYEDISALFDEIEPPIEDGVYNEHTMFVFAADLQVGKTDMLGGTEELVRRVLTSFYKAAQRASKEKPDTIVLADMGDIIENFKNTKAQRQTNDMNLTNQIRTARRILAQGVRILAPLCNRLIVVSVPSNHCQVREDFGAMASTPNDDYGIDINHSLEEIFAERSNLDHVTFLRPVDEFSEAVTLDLGNKGGVVGFVHGHQAKSQEKMSEWFKGQVHGERNGMERVRTLFYGHFHNMKMEQTGREKWLIGTPTSDAGSAWYTNQTGEQSTNGMLVLNLTDNGRWFNIEIL